MLRFQTVPKAVLRAIAACLLSFVSVAQAQTFFPGQTGNAPGDFDFYVLALSWSPSHCATNGGSRPDDLQCNARRPYGFIVHGLWPQYERGYPENCAIGNRRSGNSYVPRRIISSLSDIMPSQGLIIHEWRRHGSCSGLSPEDYFATLRRAYERVTIPGSMRNPVNDRRVDPRLVEKAFIAANPGLPADGISTACNRGHLQEVRICMTKDLQFRSCPEVDARSCRSRAVKMPGTY
ncbi:ribonuclease T [Daeguia caeni]|uniref:Ribonuclease T n=1 Tax=Daeguia caeni TaxID=439612 RepID=A0ABV9H540_9HYPH